jgi:quinol monooxygenase YgiN
MIIALGDVYAQIPRRDAVKELMGSTQLRVRDQPGCELYVFAEVVDDPGHFVVVQQWRDQAALDEHYRSPEFADYQAKIGDTLVRSSELSLHHVGETVLPLDSAPMDPRLAD